MLHYIISENVVKIAMISVLLMTLSMLIITIFTVIMNTKRYNHAVKALKGHPRLDLIKEYENTTSQMKSVFEEIADPKYAKYARFETIVRIFREAAK